MTVTRSGAPFHALQLAGGGPTVDPQPRGDLRHPGLGFSRFARHYSGNHSLFSSPRGTEMFHFPRFAPPALWIQAGVPRHDAQGVSPFGHFRLNGRLAPPRNFSQPPTSFIASEHLGIHRTPLVACLPRSLCSAPGVASRRCPLLGTGVTRAQGPGPQSSSLIQGPASVQDSRPMSHCRRLSLSRN